MISSKNKTDFEEEKNLVLGILNNDRKSLAVLYQKFEKNLFRYIKNKVEFREDAEEILQDTFISILDSLPLFGFRSSLLTWAKKIALHEVADFYRKKKIKSIVFSRLPFLENLVSRALGPEMVYEQKEIKQEIQKIFGCLSEGYGEILRLKYIEGLSMAQISQKLGKTVKAVESRLFRARDAFQKEWQINYQQEFSVSSLFSPLKKAT